MKDFKQNPLEQIFFRSTKISKCKKKFALPFMFCFQITIFRMDEDGIDIDRAILRALLKGM